MRLNDSEIETLRDLSHVSTGRPYQCARLEVAGFVVTGKSRFGEWVRITDAGRSYLSKTLSRGSRAASTRAPGDTGDSTSTPPAPAPESSVPPRKSPSEQAAPKTRRRKPCSDASSPAPVPAGPAPNAVRVRIGAKYAYYPLGMFKALKNGEAVATKHKPFKQAPVAASAEDQVFPGYAPSGV